MKLYKQTDSYTIYEGNMLDMLKVLNPNSIDSIVTDPPYGLTSIVKRFGKENSAPVKTDGNDGSFARLSKGFMGKVWDGSGVEYNVDAWKNCYTVLKPGGYLLAFGGSRTFHRIACAIEDAGFEIRDTIMWIYGSGFPKSMSLGKVIEGKQILGSANVRDIKKLDGEGGGWNSNEVEQGKRKQEYEQIKTNVNYTTELGKKWNGWGTALKPSFEPIIVARKPFKGSLVDNVIEYGVGGINIDECRVGIEERTYKGMSVNKPTGAGTFRDDNWVPKDIEVTVNGRFPANTILTYDETDFNEVCGGFPETKSQVAIGVKRTERDINQVFNSENCGLSNKVYDENRVEGYADNGSASRYFYCAKASKKDRDEGLDEFETKQCVGGGGGIGNYLNDVNSASGKFGSEKAPHKNTHPTVKPTELMQYLVRLVTPKGGTVLDPFMGSGSTGKAVMFENRERNANYKFVGIELTEEYLPICEARINYAITYTYEGKDYKPLEQSVVIPKQKVELW